MGIEGFTEYGKEDAEKYVEYRCWLGLTWGDLLDRASDFFPTKEALVDDASRLTYSQLRQKVDKLGVGLLKLGINKGDRVLLQIPNWNEFAYSFFALQKVGAIPVLLLPRHTELEINRFSHLTEPKAWILPVNYRRLNYLPIVDTVLKENPQLRYIISVRAKETRHFVRLERLMEDTDLTKSNLRKLVDRRPDAMEVAQIMPTGGTTGLPKAVPRTHNSFICNIEYAASKPCNVTSEDVILTTAPVAHGQGILMGLGRSIFNCAKFVLIDSTDPSDICRVIEEEKVTVMTTVPALINRLVNFKDLENYDLKSLRVISGGGALSTPELVKAVYDKLGCKFVNEFGSVEGSMAETRLDDDVKIICNTVGRKSCPYDIFKIIDQDENELLPNTEGELVTKGPGIFTGYFKSAQENKQVFTKDGFFRTGDLAKIDELGNIKITGRIKDIIIRGGENISATDIESLISSHTGVEDVAVIGMPDKELGERICAYIKPSAETKLTFDDVISFLRDKGASVLQLPERIEFVNEMPATKVGKVDKKALREDIKKRLGVA